MKVAFLGLGIMGRPMAANLVKAGHEVTVWNRTPGKLVSGARVAATPVEAAKGNEVIWVCVSDGEAVERVLFASDGVAGVLRPGITVVDSSTIAPEDARAIAERVTATGAAFLDAPITGGKAGAEAGKLVFIVGGPAETVAAMQPLFQAMGEKVIHFGATPLGQSAKIGMNLMVALYWEAFCEGFTLIRKLDVPIEPWLELIRSSGVRSGLVEGKSRMAVSRDFTPNFPLRLMHKDVRLMLAAAKSSGAKLPALEEVDKVFQQAGAERQDLDFAASIAVLERLAGIDGEASAARKK